jgi:hypothetical protein
LLITTPISFVIPIVQVGVLINAPIETTTIAGTAVVTAWSAIDVAMLIYTLIAVIMLSIFCTKLFRLYRLAAGANRIKSSNYQLIEIKDNNAFSFLCYLFITPELRESNTVLQHELVHIKQKHSVDILIIEVFKIINWFNPVIYLIQNDVKELHEYIADQATVVQENDIDGYANFLVSNAYGFTEHRITSNFFHKNLLKNRIIMLYKKRSGKLARLKYLAALPLFGGLLCVSTLGFSKTYGWLDLMPKQTVTRDTAKNKPKKPTKPEKPTNPAKTKNIAEPIPPAEPQKLEHHKVPPPPPPAPPKKAAKIENGTSKNVALAGPVAVVPDVPSVPANIKAKRQPATPPPPPPPAPPKKEVKITEGDPKGAVLKNPAFFIPGVAPVLVKSNNEKKC